MLHNRWQSLTEMFFAQAQKLGPKPLLYSKQNDAWVSLTWQQTCEQVVRLAAALEKMDVGPGDRVVIVSENRPEWLIADFAVMAIGAISVPTYTTNTSRDHLHILEDSSAKVAIISTKALAHTFLKAAHQSDDLCHAIVMESYTMNQHINVDLHSWQQVIDAEKTNVEHYRSRAANVSKDDIACLIYTSGTGGAPKGVMQHHGSILHNCYAASLIIKPLGLKDNRFLSFLPLSHAYEHTAGQCLPLMIGAEIWYAESIEKMAGNMAEAHPTIMIVVPRLFEMLRTRISRKIEKEGGTKEKLFKRAMELGMKQERHGQPLTTKEKLENIFLTLTVRKKVRKQFGGQLKALVSGGAPLNPDVGYFFSALGLRLLQGYGQTEAGPVISVNPSTGPRMHTVGKPLDKTDVKIAEDGEILVRGELVMKGYWGDEKSTRRTIVNGWLHTGDIGVLDSDGYLEITDRKKDLIVNDKGDNVSPQRIEGMMALEEEISQVMIYGDRRPYLVALIVPDSEWMQAWAADHNKPTDFETLRTDKDFRKAVSNAIDRINRNLSNLEKVRRFAFAHEPFSIENQQMTPTLKLKRHIVRDVYEDVFSGMY
ncbi:AMP-dependent synthetase/ligase [Kordiimonas pumila]|uniref:AMP-dependent synthetase/ligase n=1 Tax=Kordiimonas pumila TaxID=2161677 RepID=A0ABV7D4G7_9PROT|nr:AMP-dependent synthetase/ligase [Kordiimonas pumila]